MKLIRFTFFNNVNKPIIEEYDFDDNATEKEIEHEFNDWYKNEIDRAGISGYWEEVENDRI